MPTELSYDAIEVGKKYEAWEYPLAERIVRYLEATENAHPWHGERSPWGPGVVPPSILGLAALRMLETVGPVPPGTLHAKQEIDTEKALRLDRRLIGYGEFTDKFEKRGRKYFTYLARFRDETGIIIGHSRVTMAFPGETDSSGGKVREEQDHKGELTAITRTLTQEKMTAYSEDSANVARGQSIHTQPEVAKEAGFDRTVANGLIAMDYMSELMTGVFEKEWFEFAGLTTTFLRPMLRDDTITVNGRLAQEAEEGAVVRKVYDLWAENQDGVAVAAGRAQALVMPGQ